MSLQRVFTPMTSSAGFILRTVKPCHNLSRTFSSIHPTQQSAKRKMQTSTAYSPSNFDPPPPPPRNADIPDTSNAGSIPQVNDIRPPKQYGLHTQSTESNASKSLPELEAQRSTTVISVTTPSSQPKARPRSKLRARKAAMSLTPNAVSQLRALLDQPSPKLIKVSVKNRGCSGLAYHLDYVDKPDAFDETVEQDGVKVLVDSKALFSIIGSEMDWVEDKLSQRFVFKNPNISTYSQSSHLCMC